MDVGKQTAAVTSTALQKLELVNDSVVQNEKIGLLGCLNPDSYNQKDMFYLSPVSFRIRLIDNNKTINPPALSNPKYPNSYEIIFFDRGSDNANPEGWLDLYNINARTLLNIEKDTPWKITWDFDGSYGIQTAIINGVSFSRDTEIGNDGNIKGFKKWRINSPIQYGAIRATFSEKDVDHNNNLGWTNAEFMTAVGINQTDNPYSFSVIKKLVNANILNKAFRINNDGGKESIKLVQNWKTVYPNFVGNLEIFIGV